MHHFSEDDVRRLLPMKDAVAVIRQAFRDYAAGAALNQPRRRLYLDTGAVLHTLAGAWERYFGTKVYATHAKHGAWFTVLLFDAATARPLAQFEANCLGQIRTGAVSGVAADLLLEAGKPVRVGCIGSGFQAQSQLEALQAVREIASVAVWSRRAEKRERFAAGMATLLGVPVRVASSASDACAGAGVVVTATYSKEPVLEAGDVAPGTLVLAMGSNHPQRRELPGALVRAARIVVEDAECCRLEAGDLLLAGIDWESVIELKTLVAEGKPRPEADRVTVFKSVGMGMEDVAAAAWVYEHAAG